MFVIMGATGHTGGAAASALLAKGEAVTVLVRDAAKGEYWRTRGANVAVADVTDAQALARALRGAAGAYLLNPTDLRSSDVVGDAHRMCAAFARAIRDTDIAHAVVLSSLGAHVALGVGFIPTFHKIEATLGNLDRPVTFIRAAVFVQNYDAVAELARTQGILPSLLQPLDRKFDLVDTNDVGRFAADALISRPRGSRRVVEFTGPQTYSPDDAATAFTKIYGRAVNAVAPPPEQVAGLLVQSGRSAHVAQAVIEEFDALNTGKIAFEHPQAVVRGSTSLETALGREYAGVRVAS